MKKLVLLSLLLFLFPMFHKASHIVGGDMGWECLSNGMYRFNMTIYRDCSGVNFLFQNESITIKGNPLPTNGVTSIVMKPDSNRWAFNSNGTTAPECTNLYGTQLTCTQGAAGIVQAFYYVSDPVSLTGVPPTSGWDFLYASPCCQKFFNNVSGPTAGMVLKATMYPTANNTLVSSCFDSSPQFAELPQLMLCSNTEQRYNHGARDADGDSLVYRLTSPLRGNVNGQSPATYNSGFSLLNPTPGSNVNPNNIPTSLNASTGEIRFAVHNITSDQAYLKAITVENWRDGKKISEVSREYPITVTNCPTLPSGVVNRVPQVVLSSTLDASGTFTDTVIAGNVYSNTLSFLDTDSTGVGNNLQTIKVIPITGSFSDDFSTTGNCSVPSVNSCASLLPQPMFDTLLNPSRYAYRRASGQLNTNLNWQTDTSLLREGQYEKTHYFTFKCVDDHCSVPQVTYRTLALTVVPPGTITSVNELEKSKRKIALYPNPTNGNFFLNGLSPDESYQLEIRNVQGKLVQVVRISNKLTDQFSLQGDAGLYFVRLLAHNKEQVNIKLIKR